MDKDRVYTAAIEANRDRIYRICCCYVSDQDERKDVFQNVLIQIWRNLESFEGKSDISTWIYRITVNTCLGFLRSERRRREIFDRSVAAEKAEARASSESEDGGKTDADVSRLYTCIAKLPALDRTLVSLYLEELSTKQMADVLGISEANVRVKFHRIRKVLKELWEESDHGT